MDLLTIARTYGRIERIESGWLVRACEPHVAIRLKAIPSENRKRMEFMSVRHQTACSRARFQV